MSSPSDLAAGLTAESSHSVTNEDSAPHLGSGDLAVLATPRLVAWVERTCAELVQRYLLPAQSTVGVYLEVEHLAPTPVGAQVWISVELIEVNDRQLIFNAQIKDEMESVGRVQHRRVIIDRQRFLERVESKSS